MKNLRPWKKLLLFLTWEWKSKLWKGQPVLLFSVTNSLRLAYWMYRRLRIQIWVRHSLCLWYGSEDRHKYTISMKSAKCEKNYVQYMCVYDILHHIYSVYILCVCIMYILCVCFVYVYFIYMYVCVCIKINTKEYLTNSRDSGKTSKKK